MRVYEVEDLGNLILEMWYIGKWVEAGGEGTTFAEGEKEKKEGIERTRNDLNMKCNGDEGVTSGF